ncbi:MAG: class B sortase, partial [Clostridia bacterium]
MHKTKKEQNNIEKQTPKEIFFEPAEFDSKNETLNEDVFIKSIEKLRPSDIQESYKLKPQGILNSVFLIRMCMLVVCSSIFLYSLYSIAQRIIDSINARAAMDDIVNSVEKKSEVERALMNKKSSSTLNLFAALGTDDTNGGFDEIDQTGEYDAIRYKLQELKAQNNDIYGWIKTSGGMSISYPVVKGIDNDVYLSHDINGNYSRAGSIFVDYSNSKIHANNYNTIFYGHCMTNGTMFRPIFEWFRNPDFRAMANTIKIEIITLDAVYVYEIFSAYRSEGSYFITTSFANENEYYTFLKNIYKKSTTGKKTNFDPSSRIITLSTCTNVAAMPDERYVVHAILKKVI